MTAVITVNGVELVPPKILSPTEVWMLAHHNGDRLNHPDTQQTAAMKMLQLRFDWLGWRDTQGGTHAGRSATPDFWTVED